MATTNKKKGVICAVISIALLAGSTMAYFIDHEELLKSGKAGTLDIETVSHINLNDETYHGTKLER